MIFASEEMKKELLRIIRQAKARYRFRIENICIMGNHVHFIIRPGKGMSLSTIMQWILGVFAIRYNKFRRLTGHVWGDRFFSRIIRSLRAYWGEYAYIDANPRMAGLVARPEDWQYGRFHLRILGFEDVLAGPS
jgi:putative transposase